MTDPFQTITLEDGSTVTTYGFSGFAAGDIVTFGQRRYPWWRRLLARLRIWPIPAPKQFAVTNGGAWTFVPEGDEDSPNIGTFVRNPEGDQG